MYRCHSSLVAHFVRVEKKRTQEKERELNERHQARETTKHERQVEAYRPSPIDTAHGHCTKGKASHGFDGQSKDIHATTAVMMRMTKHVTLIEHSGGMHCECYTLTTKQETYSSPLQKLNILLTVLAINFSLVGVVQTLRGRPLLNSWHQKLSPTDMYHLAVARMKSDKRAQLCDLITDSLFVPIL